MVNWKSAINNYFFTIQENIMEKRTLFGGSGTLQKTILVSYRFKQLTIVFSKLSPTGQLPES